MRYVSKFLFLLLCLPFLGDAALFKASDNSKFAAVVKDIFWINDVKAAGPTQFDCKNPTDPGCGGSAFQPRDDELALEKGGAVIGGGSTGGNTGGDNTGGNTTTTEPTTQTCEAEIIELDNHALVKCCNTVNTCGDYGLLTEEEKNIKAAMYEERDNPCPASVCPDNRTIIYHRWYDCSESTEHAGCYECKLNNCREYLTGAPTSLCGIGGNIYPGDYNKSSSSSSSCRSAINEEDAVAHNYSGLMDHAKYFQVYTNEDTGDEIKCYYTCKRGDHIDSNNECDITKQGKSQGRIYKITDSKYYALKYNDVSGAIGRLASGTCGGSALSYFGGDEEAGKWKIPTPGQFIDMANWLQGSSSTETANVNEMSYNILTYNTYGSSATGSGSSWNECYLVGIPSYTENESLRCTDAHGPYISANCNTNTSSTREVKIINKWF